VVAVSPSELLPPSPARSFSVPWRKLAIAGTALLLVAVGIALATRVGQKTTPELVQEAVELIDKGDHVAAAIQLKSALQIDPNHIEARLLHGTLLLETGEFRAAEDDLRRAQELGAKREAVLPLLARSLIASKKYQEALDETAPPPGEDATKQSPALIAQRGHALFFLGRRDQAREAYEMTLSMHPDQPDALIGLARIAVVDRDLEWAMKSITRAIAKAPENPDALALLADLSRITGDEVKAALTFEKAVKIAHNNHAMRLSLASIYVGLKEHTKASSHLDYVLKAVPDSPTANFLKATIEFRQQNFAGARDLAAKVLDAQGNHIPSLLMVGASAFASREYATAEKALRRALVLVPDHVQARRLLGAALVRLKQPRQALEQLLPLVARFSKDPELLAIIGEAHLDLGEYTQASRLLEKAASLAPNDPAARMGLGRSRLASGELDRAVEDLEAASALDPQASGAKYLLAMAHLRRQEFDRAIAILSAMDSKQRSNPVALNLLGVAHIGKKDFRTATKYLEQALSVTPDYMPAVMNLTQIYLREKDVRAAVRRLETVIKQSPNNVEAMFALAAILAKDPNEQEEAVRWLERAQKASPESPEPQLRLARYHLSRGATKEALDAAQRGLEMKIDNAELLDALGQVQLATKAYRQALDTYVRMASEYPKMALAHYRLGVVQQQIANTASARQSFRNALDLQSDHVEAKVQLAQLEARAGNAGVALQLAQELQKQLPKSPLGLALKGDVLVLSNRFAEAIPAFEAAFAVEKTSAIVLKLHQTYAKLGKFEQAEHVVDDWLHLHPEDQRVRQFIADYSLSVKRYRVAQKHYEALAAAMPKNPQVLNNLAITYDALKDSRAILLADRAYQIDTRNPFVADTYAWMLVRLGRPERARDILKDAVAQLPGIPTVRYHYAVALAKSGDRKLARMELQRALDAAAPFSEADAARKLLEELKG